MSFSLIRQRAAAFLVGTLDGSDDVEIPLLSEDEIGGVAVGSRPLGVHSITTDAALEFIAALQQVAAGIATPRTPPPPPRLSALEEDDIEVLERGEDPPPPPPPPPVSNSTAVEYTPEHVIAYFDDFGKNVEKVFATWAKLWRPNGSLTIISLKEEPSAAP